MKDADSSHDQVRDESSTSSEFIEQPCFTSSENLVQPHEEDNNEISPRMSKRHRIPKFFGDDFIVYLVDDTPMSISEAIASFDADN